MEGIYITNEYSAKQSGNQFSDPKSYSTTTNHDPSNYTDPPGMVINVSSVIQNIGDLETPATIADVKQYAAMYQEKILALTETIDKVKKEIDDQERLNKSVLTNIAIAQLNCCINRNMIRCLLSILRAKGVISEEESSYIIEYGFDSDMNQDQVMKHFQEYIDENILSASEDSGYQEAKKKFEDKSGMHLVTEYEEAAKKRKAQKAEREEKDRLGQEIVELFQQKREEFLQSLAAQKDSTSTPNLKTDVTTDGVGIECSKTK